MAVSQTLKIGIIGFGPFAQFLARTMIKQGHALFATSRSDHSLLCSQLGIPFFEQANLSLSLSLSLSSSSSSTPIVTLADLLFQIDRGFNEFFESGSEVILLCTSIVSTADVLSSIPAGNLQKPRLFVDVLSVKEHPRELFLQALPEEADVLCTHPMFGPESGRDGWEGLPLVYDRVRVRNRDLCDKYLGIFQQEGCRMLEMPCEEHDRMAAKTQFLAHTIGRILDQMEIEPTPIDTKGFQKLLQVKDSSINDSLDLYIGLYQHNKFARVEMEKLELAFQAVKRMLMESVDQGLSS